MCHAVLISNQLSVNGVQVRAGRSRMGFALWWEHTEPRLRFPRPDGVLFSVI